MTLDLLRYLPLHATDIDLEAATHCAEVAVAWAERKYIAGERFSAEECRQVQKILDDAKAEVTKAKERNKNLPRPSRRKEDHGNEPN